MERLPLTDAISIDEVYLDMDNSCKYVLVLQDFHTGQPIDLVRSRRDNVTAPFFSSIPIEERRQVKYLITDMYNPYLAYVEKYFPNTVPVVDSFHVIQWITHSLDMFLRQLLREYKLRDQKRQNKLITHYWICDQQMFKEFSLLLKNYHSTIINSFVMVQRIGPDGIYDSRLSNGPIESLNRKAKDLKRSGRGYRNFNHLRNRFLFSTRFDPALNGRDDKPLTYETTDDE